MNKNITALIEGAKAVSLGMIKVAATKPNEHPLHSNAQTFRNAAHMLNALSLEVARAESQVAVLQEKLRRIADIKVRGAAEAIDAGDWKAVVEELQAVAQEGLTPGSAGPGPRAPRSGQQVPRR